MSDASGMHYIPTRGCAFREVKTLFITFKFIEKKKINSLRIGAVPVFNLTVSFDFSIRFQNVAQSK